MLSGKRRSGRGRWAARARRVPNAALLGQQTVPLLLLGASPIHPRRPAAPAHGRGHAHCRAASPASCARRGGHRTKVYLLVSPVTPRAAVVPLLEKLDAAVRDVCREGA